MQKVKSRQRESARHPTPRCDAALPHRARSSGISWISLDINREVEKIKTMLGSGSHPVLDYAEGLRRVRGNQTLYRQLVRVFLLDLPRLTSLLRAALENRSAKDLHAAAHSLKGSASHLGASAVVQSAWKLEKMGHDGDLNDVANCFQILERDLHELTPLLQSLACEEPSVDLPAHEP